MPFHVKSITKKLKEEIEKSSLTKAEKEVATFYLNQKLDDMILQPALFDFAEVLGLLSQGSIANWNYRNLGLFYDDNLVNYTPTQIRKRLEENNLLFKKVQHIHEYENLDQQLEKTFDEKGVSRLKKADWEEVDYNFVMLAHDNQQREGKKFLIYYEPSKKETEEGLVYWEKPFKETRTGQRKRHIIVFNPFKKPEVNLLFSFDEFLKKEYVHKNSNNYADASGKKLKVTLPSQQGTSFYRIIYKHNDQSKSTYEFNIAIVECNAEFLKSVQTYYEVSEKEERIIINSKGESVIIGPNKDKAQEHFAEEHDSIIELKYESDTVAISAASPGWSEDSLLFNIKIDELTIPFKIRDQVTKSTPVMGKRIWKLKREQQNHFSYDNGKLQQGTREYYPREEFKDYLDIEKKWVDQHCYYANKKANGLNAQKLVLPDLLQVAYDQLLSLYRDRNLLPSLAYLDEQLFTMSYQYVQAFIQCVTGIQENSILNTAHKDIFKLGTIEENGGLLLTPFHPLSVAYQVNLCQQVGDEQIEQHILDRLHPGNLLPYLYGKDDVLLRSVVQYDACEWMVYKPLKQVTVGESSAYMANLIEEKLQQFIEHFNYLFLPGAKSPLRLNIINITNDKEVLRGLLNFIVKQVEKNGPHKVIPLEVALYQKTNVVSSFEMLTTASSIVLGITPSSRLISSKASIPSTVAKAKSIT